MSDANICRECNRVTSLRDVVAYAYTHPEDKRIYKSWMCSRCYPVLMDPDTVDYLGAFLIEDSAEKYRMWENA
jgi:hypothetical protein